LRARCDVPTYDARVEERAVHHGRRFRAFRRQDERQAAELGRRGMPRGGELASGIKSETDRAKHLRVKLGVAGLSNGEYEQILLAVLDQLCTADERVDVVAFELEIAVGAVEAR